MEKMLEVDSDKRINAAQTLQHPYLEEVWPPMILKGYFYNKNKFQYADPSDEPTAPFYDQTFEDYDLSVDVWKGKSYFFSSVKCILFVFRKSLEYNKGFS